MEEEKRRVGNPAMHLSLQWACHPQVLVQANLKNGRVILTHFPSGCQQLTQWASVGLAQMSYDFAGKVIKARGALVG